jgi:hypothetical protein
MSSQFGMLRNILKNIYFPPISDTYMPHLRYMPVSLTFLIWKPEIISFDKFLKFLVMQFSPYSNTFPWVWSIYSSHTSVLIHPEYNNNSVVWVRERTIPTERPPLVGEVSAKFWVKRIEICVLPSAGGVEPRLLLLRALIGLLYLRRMTMSVEQSVGKENRSTRRKPAPLPLCPPQIPHDLTLARKREAAARSRRQTAWATLHPKSQSIHTKQREPRTVCFLLYWTQLYQHHSSRCIGWADYYEWWIWENEDCNSQFLKGSDNGV